MKPVLSAEFNKKGETGGELTSEGLVSLAVCEFFKDCRLEAILQRSAIVDRGSYFLPDFVGNQSLKSAEL